MKFSVKPDEFYFTNAPRDETPQRVLVMSLLVQPEEEHFLRMHDLDVTVERVATQEELRFETRRQALMRLPWVNATNVHAIIKAVERADAAVLPADGGKTESDV